MWVRQEQQLLQDHHRWWPWQTSGKAAKARGVSALLAYLESSQDEIIWCSVLLSKVLRTLWETAGVCFQLEEGPSSCLGSFVLPVILESDSYLSTLRNWEINSLLENHARARAKEAKDCSNPPLNV